MQGTSEVESDRQRERQLRQPQRSARAGVEAAAAPPGDVSPSSSPDPAAGSGDTPPRPAAKRRAAPADDGTWRAEDFDDWVARGVESATIPYVEEVIQVAHDRRWPCSVRRLEGWTCVVVPVYADLADAIEQNLSALGAVAPATERGAGANTSRRADAPTRADAAPPEETYPTGEGDLAAGSDGITWLSGPARP